jgi:hypothetical protein
MVPLFFQTCQIVFWGASEETCLKGVFSKNFFFCPNLLWVGSLDARENSKLEMYLAKNLQTHGWGARPETRLDLIRRIHVGWPNSNFYHIRSHFCTFWCTLVLSLEIFSLWVKVKTSFVFLLSRLLRMFTLVLNINKPNTFNIHSFILII